MGILNVTPDSFSDGGRYFGTAAAVARGIAMAEQGADLLDVGGESTRPGAPAVPLEEELARVVPVIAELARRVRIPISVDTSKAAVAEQAIGAGASIINDVTALRGDPGMARLAAASRAGLILMHMRGTPRTMQRAPRYGDAVEEIGRFLLEAAARAEHAGVDRRRILIDPGLGFGKTLTHNLQLLARLHALVATGYPVVLGASRKSFIGKVMGAATEDRLAGSLACAAVAAEAGVHVVRVHDVRETAQLLGVLRAIRSET